LDGEFDPPPSPQMLGAGSVQSRDFSLKLAVSASLWTRTVANLESSSKKRIDCAGCPLRRMR